MKEQASLPTEEFICSCDLALGHSNGSNAMIRLKLFNKFYDGINLGRL